MSANGRPTTESQPQSADQSEQQGQEQTSTQQPGMGTQQRGQSGPRVIRISHQTVEPVVMMQINIDGGSFVYTVVSMSCACVVDRMGEWFLYFDLTYKQTN